ncbi:MAG: restriction endonuclease subunit S [Propionibacterium acidifaciens]
MRFETKRLGDLVENLDSRRVPVASASRRTGPYPYYGASGVVDHVADYLFEGDHLLLAEDGENLRTRALPIAFLASGKFWVNNHAHVLRGREGVADTRYLSYALACVDVSGYLSGSAQPKLSQASMNEIRLRIPSLHEQRSIVEVLGALDDKSDANQKIISSLEDLLRGVYRKYVAVDDASRAFLGDMVELNPNRRIDVEVAPWIPMQALPSPGMTISSINYAEPKGGVRFKNGDTVMARITPCLENGKTAYIDCLKEGEVGFGSTEYIVMRSRKGYPSALSYFIATDPRFRSIAIQRMVGSSGRQRVKASDIENIPVSVTGDYSALMRFNELSERQISLMQSLSAESRTLASLRDTLLPALMSGELRVKDAEKQVEEVL